MKKGIAFLMVVMVVFVAACASPTETNVYSQVTVDQTEGVDSYYSDPNCFSYCHDQGWEYITCHDGEGVNYMRVFVMRPNGPCGCDPGMWDCDYWNGG